MLSAAALAVTGTGICAEAEEVISLDDRMKKAAELYAAKDYRTALTELHAIAAEGEEAGKFGEYAAKAKEILGDELGKAMATCRLLTKCKRCKGSGCPTCKTCKGLGCRDKKQKAKTRVRWTEVEQVNIARVVKRKHKDLAVPWLEVQPCKKCKGRGCRPCRTCNGTGRSLLKTGRRTSKTPAVHASEIPHLIRELTTEGERSLQKINVVNADGELSPSQIDAQDVAWAASAGKYLKQAETIAVEPSAKTELSQMAKSAALEEAKLRRALKLKWDAASEGAKRQAEAELRRLADEERARHTEKKDEDEGKKGKKGD